MAQDSSSVTQTRRSDRRYAWNSVERRGAVRKPFESDGVAFATSTPARDRIGAMSALKTIRARPLGRTLALWIIVGALWVSLGMIVSATLVTVAYLT
jgi:hypothetical protein